MGRALLTLRRQCVERDVTHVHESARRGRPNDAKAGLSQNHRGELARVCKPPLAIGDRLNVDRVRILISSPMVTPESSSPLGPLLDDRPQYNADTLRHLPRSEHPDGGPEIRTGRCWSKARVGPAVPRVGFSQGPGDGRRSRGTADRDVPVCRRVPPAAASRALRAGNEGQRSGDFMV
jgi:hypothetical protein